MRINKFIAKSGYTSRRKADDLILAGKVMVNGKVMEEPGYDVAPTDEVVINGEVLKLEEYFYIKLYKPVGYITSNFDPYNEKDLNNLVDIDQRFFAAGRLDKDSRGLLILTNDGDFTNKLIHPSHEVSKEYVVKVDRDLKSTDLHKFEGKLDIGNGEITNGASIKKLSSKTYQVIISQGFNRQIRRMFDILAYKVLDLKRVRIGEIYLDKLKPYEYVEFNNKELQFVKEIKS